MDKKELTKLGIILAGTVGGTAVATAIRNACDKGIVGSVGGLVVGLCTSIGVCKTAVELGIWPVKESEVETEPEEAEEA